MTIQPQPPEARIVLPPVVRGSHQRFWPTVEVTEHVTIIAHERWGTRAATYEVVAEAVIDTRNGHTRAAVDEAKKRAHARIADVKAALYEANPDYLDPPRYGGAA